MVELMIAVSILAIGVVMVLRSFLNSASVLDSLDNKLAAAAILEDKINGLQQKAIEEGGLEPGQTNEDMAVGNRNAVFQSEVTSSPVEGINEAKLNVSWQEENRYKDETLVVYLPNKK